MHTPPEVHTYWPSLLRYLCFVVVTLLFSFVAFGMAFAPWQLGPLVALDHVGNAVVFVLFLGWFLWGPIALLAIFPGFLFCHRLVHRMENAGLSRRTIAVLVPIPIAVFSWFGSILLLFNDLSVLPRMTLFLACGTPAAMLAGILVMGQEWGSNES